MSFPSGHSSAAFAGFGFLALYLNARLKVLGHHHRYQQDSHSAPEDEDKQHSPQHAALHNEADSRVAAHWKLLVVMLPVLVAVLIAASKVRDGWHHPVDVIFGAVVGMLFAHIAYKCVFRAVYDERVNHLPRV